VTSVASRLTPTPQTMVELGSRDVNGVVRDLFPGVAYTGVDVAPGRNVDVVADAATWQPSAPVDLVVCCEVLEHTPAAAAIVANAARMLKPGGTLILTCALKGRGAHSATGGKLAPGEFYHNPREAEMVAWVRQAGLALRVFHFHAKHRDIYVLAEKVDPAGVVTDRQVIEGEPEPMPASVPMVVSGPNTGPLTILYYTDSQLSEPMASIARRWLLKAAAGQPIISISQKPLDFGQNVCVGEIGRSHLSLYRQILAGAQAATTDVVALAEHDCFYTPEHFAWRPPDLETFYYNLSCWFVNWKPDHAERGRYSSPWGIRHATSQLICGRELLIRNLTERIAFLEQGWAIRKGMRGACEPGVAEDAAFVRKHDDGIGISAAWKSQWKAGTFQTAAPNLDVRNGENLTGWRRGNDSRWELAPWGRFDEVMQDGRPDVDTEPGGRGARTGAQTEGQGEAAPEAEAQAEDQVQAERGGRSHGGPAGVGPGYDLSVLVAARAEMFLDETIQDILAHARARTEVIVVLDGAWPVTSLPDRQHVRLIHHADAWGQRAAINEAARLSAARYVMKLDAHCAVDEGFDVKLIEPYEKGELAETDVTVPRMYNLIPFRWVCDGCGVKTDHGPRPAKCHACGHVGHTREIVWQPNRHKVNDLYYFDTDLHFQYISDRHKSGPAKDVWAARAWAQHDFPETMTCLGACWFTSRAHYWALGGCDERHGSWGQLGVEIACKSWLSGGRLVGNRRTWFSHMFRTHSGPEWGFPYPHPDHEVQAARTYSQDLWRGNRWPGQVRPLSWLVEHFAPVPTWTAEQIAALVPLRKVA
jgi:hypothetical protein